MQHGSEAEHNQVRFLPSSIPTKFDSYQVRFLPSSIPKRESPFAIDRVPSRLPKGHKNRQHSIPLRFRVLLTASIGHHLGSFAGVSVLNRIRDNK